MVGMRVAVDEDHVVAFAKPAVLVLLDSMGHAQEMAAALGFEEDVIPCPVQILFAVHQRVAVASPVAGPSLARRGLAILRVKAPNVRRQRSQRHVIDGVIKTVRPLRPLVAERDPGRAGKRHFEVRVQRLFRRHCRQRRLIKEIFAQAKSVKIADGRFNRRRLLRRPTTRAAPGSSGDADRANRW